MEKKFQDARREHTSLLAPLEKRVLVWLAERMPAWLNSDHLTALGIFGMLMAGLSFWLSRWNTLFLPLVVFWLALNWFGDSLDGTLARVRNRQRPRYGFYVDHILDAFGTIFLFGGLGLSGYITPWIAFALIIAYFLLSIEVFLATYSLGVFKLSFWKFGPTELRILMSAGVITLMFRPTVLDGKYYLFDIGGIIAISGMVIMTVLAVIQNAQTLYREEALPCGKSTQPSSNFCDFKQLAQ